jgi:hypothetical protein
VTRQQIIDLAKAARKAAEAAMGRNATDEQRATRDRLIAERDAAYAAELLSPVFPPIGMYEEYPVRCPACGDLPTKILLSRDDSLSVYRCNCAHEWKEVA